MTRTVELDLAQATLSELIAGLKPDEEVMIVENEQPITRLSGFKKGRAQFGSCKGLLTIVEDDDGVIVQNQKAIARISSPDKTRPPRIPGLMKGKLNVLAEDDEHLKDFEEYMP